MTNSRWQMNRIGFVNFWLYDEEIFPLYDGKLLLRGANASGKSITTQSFIPFVLDGDRTPGRLDPFGSSDRRMEYYFLGNGEREDVTGYLFLEFKKANTQQYRTIGIGQRAQRGKPMDFWGFLIMDGRRVGEDIFLYKSVGEKNIPYSKQEMKKELGETNFFAEKQSEYMELVNKHIFGFPKIEQYDQFIRLMIKVRAPKLSRDFKPTKVYEILNESLQTLTDEDLRAMVDAMEKMDDIQNKLESFRAASKDCQTIMNEYNNYNRFMLCKKADMYLQASRKNEANQKRVAGLEKEIEEYRSEEADLVAENQVLQQEISIQQKERELLSDIELTASVEKLGDRKKEEGELLTQKKAIQEKIDRNEDVIRQYQAELRGAENDVSQCQREMDVTIDELSELNETLCYSGQQGVRKLVRGGERAAFAQVNTELKELQTAVKKGTSALRKLNDAEKIWSKTEEELSKLNVQKIQWEEETKTAETMEMQCRDDLIENFCILADGSKELSLGKIELDMIVNKIGQYQGPRDFPSIRKILDGIKYNREKLLLQSMTKYSGELEHSRKDYNNAVQQLERLKKTSELLPPRRESAVRAREVLRQNKICCAPLYEVLEFAEDAADREQALMEAQLQDMGLLDALVVAKNDYVRAKGLLDGFSDSLICVTAKAATREHPVKLKAVSVDADLRDAADAFLSSISEIETADSFTVITSGGYYRNGALEGYSLAEGDSCFIGIENRRRKQQEQIAEGERQCEQLKEAMELIVHTLESLQESRKTLNEEYLQIPDFENLDNAVDMVRDTNYRLSNAVREWEQKEGELAQALQIKKAFDQEVIASCKALPYERKMDTYEAVEEALREYKEHFSELEKQAVHLEMVMARGRNIRDLIDKENEVRDNYFVQMQKVEYDLKLCSKEIERLEEFLNRPENREIAEKLAKLRTELEERQQRYRGNDNRLSSLSTAVMLKVQELGGVKADWQQHVERENVSRAYFEEEINLKFVMDRAGKDLHQCAQEAMELMKESDTRHSVSDVVSALHKVYQYNSSNLVGYGTTLEDCFDEDQSGLGMLRKRLRVISIWRGRKVQMDEFHQMLNNSIEETELMIQESDRVLFEDILADTLSRKLSNRIAESKQWIADMSKLMREMDTSMGLTFSLDWRSKKAEGEDELDTQELEKLLNRDKMLLTATDMEKVSAHFRSKINMAKRVAEESGEGVNYGDLVRDALDYRKWFEFRMHFYRNADGKKELTNSAFNKFSGGEKAMAMYVPLFAAVNAQYKKSDNPSHPRIIALDEAFAGVDDKNISSMFELVQKLDFDYIMNSQALWGCYETVKNLMIAELHRPANADMVTVIYYTWDGRERALYEG